jgi:hypothetical protein
MRANLSDRGLFGLSAIARLPVRIFLTNSMCAGQRLVCAFKRFINLLSSAYYQIAGISQASTEIIPSTDCFS